MQNDLSLRETICEVGRRAYARQMGAANDGNISVRLDDETLLCTPTNVSKGFMTPEMICRIDRNGRLLEDQGWRPSTEISLHLRVYERRRDIRAVVHAHPLYATVHAVCGRPLTQQIMPESTMFLGEVPLTPYGLPSTDELSDAVTPYLDHYDAVLLESHGALTYGHDLMSAYFKMEALDYYAKVVYLAASYGGAKEFNAEQVAKLLEVRRTRFPQPGRSPFVEARVSPRASSRQDPNTGGSNVR